MSQPVYKMFLGKPKPSWYRLSKKEQDDLMTKVNGCLEKVGGKRLVMCDCKWSNEQWWYFGVEQFRDAEAAQKHSELLAELNWPFELTDSFSILGTELK